MDEGAEVHVDKPQMGSGLGFVSVRQQMTDIRCNALYTSVRRLYSLV